MAIIFPLKTFLHQTLHLYLIFTLILAIYFYLLLNLFVWLEALNAE